MKARIGFVTNSSSSSFIICASGAEATERIKMKLGEAVLKACTECVLENKDDVDEYFEIDYLDDGEKIPDEYHQCLKIVADGGVAYSLNVDNEEEDRAVSALIRVAGLTEGVSVIDAG